ncbi:hypothetical protein [Halodurantibacterium flavum]|uniref:Uncharacterized protein n=1 Tax=Halodurantibacterium flavum TaxID=1382802 RepID=A0ABW4S964_9RHOB
MAEPTTPKRPISERQRFTEHLLAASMKADEFAHRARMAAAEAAKDGESFTFLHAMTTESYEAVQFWFQAAQKALNEGKNGLGDSK